MMDVFWIGCGVNVLAPIVWLIGPWSDAAAEKHHALAYAWAILMGLTTLILAGILT